jgi:hypothetical protein
VAAAAIGFVVAGGLVAYGLSQTADAGAPGPNVPPAIVHTTQPVAGGTVPVMSDVNQVPTDTADIALPPLSPSMAP